jgi:class 3 adenylate cyclase
LKKISSRDAYKNFGDVFRSAYQPKRFQEQLTKQASAGLQLPQPVQASAVSLGHPEYIALQPGETRTSNAVVAFVDIRGFTKISFVLDPADLLRIVQALTEASIRVIRDGGGYIGEFTGDGVMAYFGDSSMSDTEATTAALETTSLLFKTVDEIVNPELKGEGIDPIRIAAGMEYGKVLWSRIGTLEASQIKPISRATFLAGKLSSSDTKAWDCKIGAELAKWVPEEYLAKVPQYGPFTVNGKQISCELYLLDWREVAKQALLDENKIEERIRQRARAILGGTSVLSGTTPVQPQKTPGPRPLKDQPFFGEA